MILRPTPQDYDELLTVWEASVRSTHHFLAEKDIQFYKPLIREQYFLAVELYIIRNEKEEIAAFMGLSDELIEMLFVRPDQQGKGIRERHRRIWIRRPLIWIVLLGIGWRLNICGQNHFIIGRRKIIGMRCPLSIWL